MALVEWISAVTVTAVAATLVGISRWAAVLAGRMTVAEEKIEQCERQHESRADPIYQTQRRVDGLDREVEHLADRVDRHEEKLDAISNGVNELLRRIPMDGNGRARS